MVLTKPQVSNLLVTMRFKQHVTLQQIAPVGSLQSCKPRVLWCIHIVVIIIIICLMLAHHVLLKFIIVGILIFPYLLSDEWVLYNNRAATCIQLFKCLNGWSLFCMFDPVNPLIQFRESKLKSWEFSFPISTSLVEFAHPKVVN